MSKNLVERGQIKKKTNKKLVKAIKIQVTRKKDMKHGTTDIKQVKSKNDFKTNLIFKKSKHSLKPVKWSWTINEWNAMKTVEDLANIVE